MTSRISIASLRQLSSPNYEIRSGRIVRGVCIAAVSLGFLLAGSAAQAQIDDEVSNDATAAVTASILGQYSANVAVANTITLTRTPVTVGTTTTYWDITINLTPVLNTSDVVTSFTPSVTAVHSPSLTVGAFKAGIYVGPAAIDTGKMGFTLTGPGIASGVTTWTTSSAAGYDGCSVPNTAEFWVGTLSSNPIYARLKKAGITSTDWSYGELGTVACVPGDVDHYNWSTNAIIGLSQVGNTITIASFSSNGTDYSTPVDQFTYTFK